MKRNITLDLDFQEIEEYLEITATQKTFIYPKNLYTLAECISLSNLYKKYKQLNVDRVITRRNDEEKFIYEHSCSMCGQIKIKNTGTVKFREYLYELATTRNKNDMCENCTHTASIVAEEKRRSIEIEREKVIAENTKNFIESFLNINHIWPTGLSPSEKYQNTLAHIRGCDTEQIKAHIKTLHYTHFLNTPYWKAIAVYTKYRAYHKCVFCDSSDNLVTHHKTYAHHGEELFYLSDLVVLCKPCHHKHHKEHNENIT